MPDRARRAAVFSKHLRSDLREEAWGYEMQVGYYTDVAAHGRRVLAQRVYSTQIFPRSIDEGQTSQYRQWFRLNLPHDVQQALTTADGSAPSLEGVFLDSSYHPRTFGNFARLLGRYVRDESLIPLQEAIRRLTSYPAQVLSLSGHGYLRPGHFADVVVFDPATIQDHATFDNPKQYATGVSHVAVNGALALENGEPTAVRPGRIVRGRAATLKKGGGCRNAAADWTWSP